MQWRVTGVSPMIYLFGLEQQPKHMTQTAPRPREAVEKTIKENKTMPDMRTFKSQTCAAWLVAKMTRQECKRATIKEM